MRNQLVRVWVNTLEPGTHICRRAVDRRLAIEVVLPFEACAEPRPDWGEYDPVVTAQAVERTLRLRGLLPRFDPLREECMIGVETVRGAEQ
jgi:hypothetical protein